MNGAAKRSFSGNGHHRRQADGAILASMGKPQFYRTAVAAASAKPETQRDFFPLTVNYQEKTFAAGKIPGGFFKREGRPSEAETLISRLIDRPIRPLFPKSFKKMKHSYLYSDVMIWKTIPASLP